MLVGVIFNHTDQWHYSIVGTGCLFVADQNRCLLKTTTKLERTSDIIVKYLTCLTDSFHCQMELSKGGVEMWP